MDTYLIHFGIKGQKWGKRNGPPYPLDYESHSAKQKKENPKGRLDNYKNNNPKNKKDKLYEKYKANGYSNETSKKLADNKKKLLKVLAITAGVTVAGLAAYSLYKTGRAKSIEMIGKEGMTLLKDSKIQRITMNPDDYKNLERIYASSDKVDNMKYKGMYSLQQVLQGGKLPYKVELKAVKDIKVASESEAKQIYRNLIINNKEFRDKAKTSLEDYGLGYMIGGKDRTISYDDYNRIIGLMGSGDSRMKNLESSYNMFFNELKKQGYDAILDANDRKYSGYNAKSPIILFNKDAVVSNLVKEVTTKDMVKDVIGNEMIEKGNKWIIAAGLLTASASANISNAKEEKIKKSESKGDTRK